METSLRQRLELNCGTTASSPLRWTLLSVVVGCLPACGASSQDTSTEATGVTQQADANRNGSLSNALIELQVSHNTCVANQAQQYFNIINRGTTSIKASDLQIKFWAYDTSSSNLVGEVYYAGCLTSSNGNCFHQVVGAKATATTFSPATGTDNSHQANREVTISTTDATVLAPGQGWNNVQVGLHMANWANFTPGTSNWFSPCVAGGGYQTDPHFAVYYQGALVFTSGITAPPGRGPRGTQQLQGYLNSKIAGTPTRICPIPRPQNPNDASTIWTALARLLAFSALVLTLILTTSTATWRLTMCTT